MHRGASLLSMSGKAKLKSIVEKANANSWPTSRDRLQHLEDIHDFAAVYGHTITEENEGTVARMLGGLVQDCTYKVLTERRAASPRFQAWG
jgi:hypothetical protein